MNQLEDYKTIGIKENIVEEWEEGTNVKIGAHTAVGNLLEYDINFEPANGIGANYIMNV